MVEEVIAFAIAAVVMLWAFNAAAFAFSGSAGSGLHELAPPPKEASMPSTADIEGRDRRRRRVYQGLLYLISFGVMAAFAGLLIGTFTA
jgi:hypothetical protein